jgi:6-pyruvoyltetrahydropterin/6-carboxytetrahydropterin synthase
MYKLKYRTHFDAAHQLLDSESLVTKKCSKLHGHRWEVEVIIKTDRLKDGMIIDFKEIKEVVDKLDHQYLNDFYENPTAEIISTSIYKTLKEKCLKRLESFTLEVTVWESPNALITYNEKSIL